MLIKIILAVLFVGTVFGANMAVAHWGVVPVGFGLSAPAGVYFVGVAFTLRDFLHERGGRTWVLGAIAIGALASFMVEDAQKFAIASGIAFAVSESLDLAVYEPLRKKHWLGAVGASNTVGLVVDSALFLWLAFGSFDFLWGQVLGKGYMTVAAVALLWAWRRKNAE